MNKEEIREKTFAVLKTIAPEIQEEEINLDEELRDQVDIDSMDYLTFLIALSKTFNINIPESDYNKIQSLNQLFQYLKSRSSK